MNNIKRKVAKNVLCYELYCKVIPHRLKSIINN